MPVYNGEKYIHYAIDSVLQQTYKDFEFLIINDGSKDNTQGIIDRYKKKDNRIRIFINNENIGISKSLNYGLKQAKGQLIARIDSDDIWHKEKLSKQLLCMDNDPTLYLLGTAKTLINESGDIIPSVEKQFFSYREIKSNILKNNLFCHSSVIFKKSLLKEIGYYNENFLNTEDYEYWIRILTGRKGEILNESLVFYRIHKNMISLKKRKQQNLYVIKAKFRGIFQYGYSFIYLVYILKDIWPLLIPDFLIRIKKNMLRNTKNVF